MREIKFRAWTEPENKMLTWNNLLNMNLHNALTIPEQCGLILMQYTGIKDKKGNEIYEGDIVKFEQQGIKATGKIVCEKGCYFAIIDNKYRCWLDAGIKKFKGVLIGNIYETPELLEVKDEL